MSFVNPAIRPFASALTHYLNETTVLQRKTKVYIVGSPTRVMKENTLNRGSEMLSCARSRRNFLKTSSLGALAFALSNRASSYVSGAEHAGELLMFVGCYTSGGSRGIYLYRFHLSSGELVRLNVTE